MSENSTAQPFRSKTARTLYERGEELKKLRDGWDSYGALAPDPEVIDKAVNLAVSIAPSFSYPPSIVPLVDGGAQVEWHCDGWDVEVYLEKHRG